jgi:NADH dehydrogenase/NADH:ubiquinone oxidoreductase subunit G
MENRKAMINITIDGMACKAKPGATILQVARDNGIDIPTLCHNESLGPEGRCRLCMLEVKKGNRVRLVTSCLYPVEGCLQVQTQAEKVRRVRKMVLGLLWARCPDSEVIGEMGRKMGVEKFRFKRDEGNSKCILCGQCAKACEEAVGVSAIGLSMRGSIKKVGTPYAEPTGVCIGCGACQYICPTGGPSP